MRRIRVTTATPGRTCIALFRRDGNDSQSMRQVRALWNAGGAVNDWHESREGMNDAPWAVSAYWPYMFVFGDGLIGMCRPNEIGPALASCGLRLTEGGE